MMPAPLRRAALVAALACAAPSLAAPGEPAAASEYGPDTAPIPGVAPAGVAPADPQAIDDTARAIGLGLRCPVCQGLSAADSTSPAAVNMQRRIRGLVAQGYDRAQIEAYFQSRYGEWVLLAPTSEGLNQVVWVGPLAAGLIALGLALGLVARRPQERTSHGSAADRPPTDLPDDPYARALLAEADDDGAPS